MVCNGTTNRPGEKGLFRRESGCWLQSLKEVLIIRLENIGISEVGVNV